MSIVRTKKTVNYSVVSNIPSNDEDLSWEARGIMSYLLSKPDTWTVSVTNLMLEGHTGRDKIQRILKELENAGYLERNYRQVIPGGKFYYETIIYESGNRDKKSL